MQMSEWTIARISCVRSELANLFFYWKKAPKRRFALHVAFVLDESPRSSVPPDVAASATAGHLSDRSRLAGQF